MGVFDDDLKNIIQAEFAVSIVVSRGSDSVATTGLYANPTIEDENQSRNSYKTRKRDAYVTLYKDDVDFAIDENCSVTVNGVTYSVRRVEPDDDGSIVVRLG